MMALTQIGPAIEEIYGRARMLFFYMLTGVVANLGSELLGLQNVSAGASGAIMGLCGIAAGWGQRDGTTVGRDIRNRMLKWGAYTLLFGLFIHADNAAHFWGFASGAVIGYLTKPRWLRGQGLGAIGVLMGVLGMIAATASVAYAVFPHEGPSEFRGYFSGNARSGADAYYRHWKRTCALHAQGKATQALDEFRTMMAQRKKTGFPIEPQVLDGVCAELATLKELCAKDDLQGYRAKLYQGRDEGADGEEEQAAELFKFTCARLKD